MRRALCLNHAEFKLTDEVLEKSIGRAKQAGLEVLACAETAERAEAIANMRIKPDMIAIEPPELIGGDISVSTANPADNHGNCIKDQGHSTGDKDFMWRRNKNKAGCRDCSKAGRKWGFCRIWVIKVADKEKAISELAKGL